LFFLAAVRLDSEHLHVGIENADLGSGGLVLDDVHLDPGDVQGPQPRGQSPRDLRRQAMMDVGTEVSLQERVHAGKRGRHRIGHCSHEGPLGRSVAIPWRNCVARL
jgi:hypothetical protein